jgi:hypothetical protein
LSVKIRRLIAWYLCVLCFDELIVCGESISNRPEQGQYSSFRLLQRRRLKTSLNSLAIGLGLVWLHWVEFSWSCCLGDSNEAGQTSLEERKVEADCSLNGWALTKLFLETAWTILKPTYTLNGSNNLKPAIFTKTQSFGLVQPSDYYEIRVQLSL